VTKFGQRSVDHLVLDQLTDDKQARPIIAAFLWLHMDGNLEELIVQLMSVRHQDDVNEMMFYQNIVLPEYSY